MAEHTPVHCGSSCAAWDFLVDALGETMRPEPGDDANELVELIVEISDGESLVRLTVWSTPYERYTMSVDVSVGAGSHRHWGGFFGRSPSDAVRLLLTRPRLGRIVKERLKLGDGVVDNEHDRQSVRPGDHRSTILMVSSAMRQAFEDLFEPRP